MPEIESPLILSLETATRSGSVALTQGARLLALRAGEGQLSHSTVLLQRIEEALAEAGAALKEVGLYAVASGPGSFTGLRIGIATVKSFAATLNRPCIGIPTLHAVAHAAGISTHTLALIPAGRGEVFAQLLSVDEAGAVTPLNSAVHQAPGKLLDSLVHLQPLKFAGEGVSLCLADIRTRADQNGISLSNEITGESASAGNGGAGWILAAPTAALAVNIGALAERGRQTKENLEPQQLRAIYVRPSDAELVAQAQ